jgi:LPS O-antigen subunit length determinant protein (WzzB/FepE family)
VQIGKHIKLLTVAGAVGVIAALALSFAVPSQYVSETVMLVEGPPTPQARTDFIKVLGERAWPRIVLERLIEQFNLYPDKQGTPMGELATQMQKQITIAAVGTRDNGYGTTYAIRYRYTGPEEAQKVVADLQSRLIEENHHGQELGVPGAHLEVISPPSRPVIPVSPRRGLLAFEGLIAGLLVGLALALRGRSRKKDAA